MSKQNNIYRGFTGVTAVIPVVTETESLQQTVDLIMKSSGEEIGQIILVICDATTPESRSVCDEIKQNLGGITLIHEQRRPFLGNAIREAFELASQSHVVMMASDLETDPRTFPLLVEAGSKQPNAVITASRWLRKGSFSEYGPVRVFMNWIFQALARLVYQTSLSDLTFGYRLFPTKLVQAIEWKYERHNFLLETILKPIRLGVTVAEVPTSWVPRSEGESQNNLRKQAEYIGTLFRCRFAGRKHILKPGRRLADIRVESLG
jgi:hypothetical protein